MKKLLVMLIIGWACLLSASDGSEVDSQRARGCVNSTFSICVVPVLAIFSPYIDGLYGAKISVNGYVKRIDGLLLLFPDKDSAEHVMLEQAILLSIKDPVAFGDVHANRYMQAIGVLVRSSEPAYWAEIELTSSLQGLPIYSDEPVQPAPPKPNSQ